MHSMNSERCDILSINEENQCQPVIQFLKTSAPTRSGTTLTKHGSTFSRTWEGIEGTNWSMARADAGEPCFCPPKHAPDGWILHELTENEHLEDFKSLWLLKTLNPVSCIQILLQKRNRAAAVVCEERNHLQRDP